MGSIAASVLALVLVCLQCFIMASPKDPSHGTEGVRDQPVVYEISTRPWLYSLALSGLPANCGQYVCLKDVPRNIWESIAKDSVDMVWLMGVWQLGDFGLHHDRSPDNIKSFRETLPDVQSTDVIGSPYAIWNYSVNSDIGTGADLAAVRGTLHELGLHLMLDFVPNHGAVDSPLVRAHPSVFIRKPTFHWFSHKWWIRREGHTLAFGRGPYDDPWTDTLQFNYWHPDTVAIMTGILQTIASQADAIRCDMSMLILNDVIQHTWGSLMSANGFLRPKQEFWKVAIDAVRARHPKALFMAEAYNYFLTSPPEKQMLQSLGFDVVYDKTILDNLNQSNLDSLKRYIRSESQNFFRRTAHFVENHDEKRSVVALGGPEQAFVGSVVAATLPGLRLFYFGQFDGFSAKLDVHLRRATAQTPNLALHRRYSALLRILADDVFHQGTWSFISVPKEGTGWHLCAWRWASRDGTRKRLVVVNFSDGEGSAWVQVEDAQGPGGADLLIVRELLTGTAHQRSASEMRSKGLLCRQAPWSAQIFDYAAEPMQLFS
eukprot:CAMPEP_0179023896 /NCGR_PEP_ID=MMETSP0796-20121207/7174_1 /TAXON_ID=73915 /ORGANISM="Pyrodinium bahamense, Strain pbaha01" /LENGTH=544 /DNA_ID=CAMNT_0020719837 /DNA_START=22 /DNA_END=1656 /DNA_ORIENTATION=-